MSRRSHIPALDGLRGFAITMVFVLHYGGGAQSKNPVLHAIGSVIKLGWVGVPLFFVLSGFLITGILWDSFDQTGWWKSFYLRRALRIFPLYYFSLFFVACAAFFWGDIRECFHNIWIYALFLQNLPFAEIRIKHLGTPVVLHAFSSLAIEEQFYIFWPLLLVLTSTLRRAKSLCVLVFVVAFLDRAYFCIPGHDLQSAIVGTVARGGELAAGAWLALHLRGDAEAWRRLQRWSPFFAAISFAGFIFAISYSAELYTAQRMTNVFGLVFLATLFASLLCMAVTADTIVERLFSFYPLRWMGTISYSLYIWHELLSIPISRFCIVLVGRFGRDAQLGARFLLGAMICVPVSYLSYRYLEMPILRLKDRLPGSRTAVPTPKNDILVA